MEEFFNQGERLTAEKLNEVARAAFNELTEENYRSRVTPNKDFLEGYNNTGSAISKNAIIGIGANENWKTPARNEVFKINYNVRGNPVLLCTNGNFQIANGAKFKLYPIPVNVPIELAVTGAAPSIGDICGPDPNGSGVSASTCGLLCLSKTQPSSSPDKRWFIRYPGNFNFIGKVTVAVTAVNTTTGALGQGKVKVCYRNPTGHILTLAKKPLDNLDWELDVFNSSTSTYSVDDYVSVSERLGIGLCVDSGSGSNVRSATLYGGTLTAGGNQTATLRNFNGTVFSDGTAGGITVYDDNLLVTETVPVNSRIIVSQLIGNKYLFVNYNRCS